MTSFTSVQVSAKDGLLPVFVAMSPVDAGESIIIAQKANAFGPGFVSIYIAPDDIPNVIKALTAAYESNEEKLNACEVRDDA